ncbi:sensor histidine kinase [Abyssisolibacter fermentans]|uniref:sensor histidine kinase n=1 Tax=Abyssisolibacter fermentans TaxID=1766203 RepID=UPI00082F9D28|nr:ATP-binding protein [Abyssisolibacter fermentans]
MFKKLHLKLTLNITIVLVVLVAIYSFIVYGFIYRGNKNPAQLILREAVSHVSDLNEIPDYPPKPKRFPKNNHKTVNIFNLKFNKDLHYVLRNTDLTITATTLDEVFDDDSLKKYALKVLKTKGSLTITTEINEESVRMITAYINKNGIEGIAQVFYNRDAEIFFMTRLMTTFITIGLLSIIVLVIISWYLAKKALEPIKKSWQQQKDFVADASHELRTPLTVIQTNLEVLESCENETIADNKQWLDNAYAETRVMSKLIDDLLLLAKIDAKQVALEQKEFNISKIAVEVSAQMYPLFKKKSIVFTTSIVDSINFNGDETRIKQLIIVLLENALKYTQEEGKVSLTLEKKDNKVIILVEDNGIGIAHEDKERIFDRFYRADKARFREEGGTGLGLSIASWITSLYDGAIRVESEIGKGSKFHVELKIYRK